MTACDHKAHKIRSSDWAGLLYKQLNKGDDINWLEGFYVSLTHSFSSFVSRVLCHHQQNVGLKS